MLKFKEAVPYGQRNMDFSRFHYVLTEFIYLFICISVQFKFKLQYHPNL
jgi:hypothetical protein